MALASRPSRQVRGRGRRWLLLGVLASLVVLLVNAAMSARSAAPQRQLAEQAYLDQALPAIESSTLEGADIATVRTQAPKVSASTITSRLGQVAAEAQQGLRTVQNLNPPPALRTAHALLVATLALRADGAKSLSRAIGTALGASSPALGVQVLTDVGLDFQAADRAYSLFEQALPPVGVQVPPSRWINDSSAYSPASLTVFVQSVQSAGSSSPIHRVDVVTVTTDPHPVSLNGSTQVLPSQKSLNVHIVVADTGNQPEKNLTVSATIQPSVAGPTQMVRDFVNLSPGDSRTVSLGGLGVKPGVPTTLTISVGPISHPADPALSTKVITIEMQ